jgi:hypothetical protein
VQQYFQRENNKELTIHCALDWSALFLLDHGSPRRCCLWNEVTPNEWFSTTVYIVRI